MTLFRATSPYDWPALLSLIQQEFAYMQGRIDPPSSMHRLTVATIAHQSATGEIWVIGRPTPIACIFLTPKPHALYLGKIAVHSDHRGKGLARCLIDLAAMRARALHLPTLELQTRVELVENHAAFAALGFARVAETAHKGYSRPTSITLQREISP